MLITYVSKIFDYIFDPARLILILFHMLTQTFSHSVEQIMAYYQSGIVNTLWPTCVIVCRLFFFLSVDRATDYSGGAQACAFKFSSHNILE